MNNINCVSFHGNGSESTGSLAHRNQPVECPTCGRVSFKGSSDVYEKEGTSAIGVIAGLAALTAAGIIGLGYAHKTNVLSKMSDGKIKEFLSKAEPAAKKCHEWCSTVKTKSTECFNKIKDFFSSKKS